MKATLRHRLKIAAAILAGLFIIAVVIALLPGFQRWVALGQLQKIDPDAQLERIHVTPFSTELGGLALSDKGWSAELDSLQVDYSPFSLLAKHLNAGDCTVEGLRIRVNPDELELTEEDLEEEEAEEGFPGLLALTETGFKLSCESLEADIAIMLPTLEAKAKLSGANLAPGATGTFQIELLTLNLPGQETLRRITVTGPVKITEGESGSVDAIAWDLTALAEGELFDKEALLLIKGAIEDGGEQNKEADDKLTYPPENIEMTVAEGGREAGSEPLFSMKATYDAAVQDFTSQITVAADNATLDPFALALDLPEFRGTGQGSFDWSLLTQQGKSAMELDATLTRLDRLSNALADIEELAIKERHQLTIDAEKLVLEHFELLVTQPGQDPALDLSINQALTFQLVDADTFLAGLDGTWLRLQSEIPLEWFDSVLGGFQLEGAALRGTLQFTGNPLKQVRIHADEPFTVSGARLMREDTQLLDAVSMQLIPDVKASPQKISAKVKDLRVRARGMDIVTGEAIATVDLTASEGFRASLDAQMEAFARGLVSQQIETAKSEDKEAIATDAQKRSAAAFKALGPSSLKLGLQAEAIPDQVILKAASLLLRRESGESLADVDLASQVKALFDGETVEFEGLEGTWVNASITGTPVALLDVFVDDYSLKGGNIKGSFTVGATDTQGGFAVDFTEPLSIEQLSVAKADQTFLQSVDINLRPSITYAPGNLILNVPEFSALHEGQELAGGSLLADAKLQRLQPESVTFEVQGRAGLMPLLSQPVLQPLVKIPLEKAYSATLEVEGNSDLKSVELSALTAIFKLPGGEDAVVMQTTAPLKVSTFDIADLATALSSVEGQGTLSMVKFPLSLPLHFIDAFPYKLSSGELGGTFEWVIQDATAELSASDAFVVNELTVTQGDKPFLSDLYFSANPAGSLTAKEVALTLDAIELRSGSASAEPLDGEMKASLVFDTPMPLEAFDGSLRGPVTAWFRQPLMPPNTLSAGQLDAAVEVSADGKTRFNASLDGLAFKDKAPYVTSAYIEGNGQLDPAQQRYTATMPATLETLDGMTDAKTELNYMVEEQLAKSSIVVNGQTLRIGDIEFIVREFLDVGEKGKATVHPRPGVDSLTEAGSREKKESYEQHSVQRRELEVSTQQADNDESEAEEEQQEEEPPERIDFAALSEKAAKPKAQNPDAEPFWKGLPRTTASFRFEEVPYKGYVRFTEVMGEATIKDEQLSLNSFSARFHEASIEGKGSVEWDEAAMPKPYKLDTSAKVADFNLEAFFGELVPGQKARVEGLFKMDAKAAGDFPNLEEARNFLTFGLDMESRSGLFRAIPPNSNLAQTTSGTAAFFGEVLSYVPTSALGMGTLSRLVSYMREVPYKVVALNIQRETDLNIRIERLEVRSDQMLILGRGGILYEENEDILDQPLDLTASMDARGEFAAILSGLGLLTDKSAGNNYWRGFDFRIWGSLADTKTNFNNIVTQASSGTLTRNVTNPFHGIWSNIKYGGEGPEPEAEAGPPAKEQAVDSAEDKP